uniref:Uncharacterized protein n=1 Tax=Adineta vaga TaxID=104782 RepID=B3G4C8_ADIVA|nr:unknown [Adineta vaga]
MDNFYNFSRFSFQLFFLLKNLCKLTNNTIYSSLDTFRQTQLVTADLLSVDIFNYQMNNAIQQFQSKLGDTFVSFFQLTHNISYVNQILVNSNNPRYNFIGSFPNIITFSINSYSGGNGNSSYICSCANDINCETNMVLFCADSIPTSKYMVPGVYKACSSLESLLYSTIACFFDNSDCFTNINNFYNAVWFNYSERHNSSLSSRFITNSSIGILLFELFIENWSQLLNYSSYFNHWSYRWTFGIYAHRCSLRHDDLLCDYSSTKTPKRHYSIDQVRHWLKKLNVFNNPTLNTPDHVIQQQRQATYVYLILLSVALFTLVIYNSLTYSTTTFTLINPSLEQHHYSMNTIDCSCSQLAISYSSFIEFECSFHPLCKSHFISSEYLLELFLLYDSLDDAINVARQNYLASFFISVSLINYNLFDKQINASLDQFKSTLSDHYLNNLRLIRDMMQSKAFVSLYSTNWYPVLYNWSSWNYFSTIYMKPQHYGNCNCLTSSACNQPSTPFIQGYFVGCTPLEALLHSSIECM